MVGTNYFTKYTSTVNVALTDLSGNAALINCVAASLPTDKGYAVGCLAYATDTGAFYTNTGNTTTASFTLISASSVTVPTALSDSSTTTGVSLSITPSAITTGKVISAINGNTTNFTTGAALFYGNMGTAAAGNGLAIIGTGTYTGTGLLTLTSNSATTGTIAALSATGLTSGVGFSLTGGGSNALTAGILLDVETGASTVGAGIKVVSSGAYTDVASALVNITASSATTGNVLGVLTPSSKALVVGRVYATPAFQVDSSTATQVAGIKITGAVTGGTPTISAIDSGAAANIDIEAKGTGNIILGGTSTGYIFEGRTSAGTILSGVINTTIATQNGTPTPAQLFGGLITHTSTTGAGTLTLPLGSAMDTALGAGVGSGDSQWTQYCNVGTQTVTITAAAGFTITGTAAVPSGKNAQLYSVRTGANTWVCNITLSA